MLETRLLSFSAGGAISLSECPAANLSQVVFLDNQAQGIPPAQASPYACGNGHGGALCIDGISRSTISLQSAVFTNNSASFGGAVDVHSNPSCTPQQLMEGCFTAKFDSACNFTGNVAAGGAGGAIFWSHPCNLNISCSDSDSAKSDTAGGDVAVAVDMQSNATACSSWMGNTVTGDGYGPVIATTAFYIQPTISTLPYYTSNEPLLLNVTMQVCT